MIYGKNKIQLQTREIELGSRVRCSVSYHLMQPVLSFLWLNIQNRLLKAILPAVLHLVICPQLNLIKSRGSP